MKSKIEWTDQTHNLITGCLNHTDGLCKGGGFPCYADKWANIRLKEVYCKNQNVAPISLESAIKGGVYADPFYPRLWPDRFNKKFPKGTKVFLNDMSDWMGIGIPDEWTRKCIDYIKSQPDIIFQTLTKQPQRLVGWEYPDNCWIGVTITGSSHNIDKFKTLSCMETIKAKVKFISFEPLLESICIGYRPLWWVDKFMDAGINWLIIGACTGTKQEMLDLQKRYPELTIMPFGNKWTAQPKTEWVKEIVEAADKAGIPVFLKDNLKPLLCGWYETPEEEVYVGELRQEFP